MNLNFPLSLRLQESSRAGLQDRVQLLIDGDDLAPSPEIDSAAAPLRTL